MQAIILKCAPNSRFHFGDVDEMQSTVLNDTAVYIHSDVLFGAFLHAVNLRYPAKTETFIQYFHEGTLAISSGFYCIENTNSNEFIYLLPKPASLNFAQTNEPKKLKKIQFISKGIWEKGIVPAQWIDEEGECFMPSKIFVVLKEETDNTNVRFKLYEKNDSPKIKVRTENKEGNFYHQTDLLLPGNENRQIHWYFLLRSGLGENDTIIMQQVFADMALAGIGGERSTGCGQIQSVEFRDFSFNTLAENDTAQYASLSLTIPSDEEETNKLLLYQVKKRGGMFLGKTERLKMINTVLEGAVQTGKINGAIADLSAYERQSLRYGKNFAVPMPLSFYFKE